MKTTTVGRLMVNKALPEELRDDQRVLDKKGLSALLRQLAIEHPEKYREVSHRLSQIGWHAAYTTGGNSFGLQHLFTSKKALQLRQKLQKAVREILDSDDLTDEQRDQEIIKAVGKASASQQKEIYEESLAEENPLAFQVLSGSRGNPMNLASLRGSDMLYTDHRDKILPIPILRSYSEGLRPVEYWSGAYGARKGVYDTKFSVQQSGYLSKQLNQITHRALVTALDRDDDAPTLRGMPVEVDDDDSEGSLLARDVGDFKRNTIITPKILQALRRKGIRRILVRSPIVGGTADGGVFARDAGVREFGRLPEIGENVGMTAAQALSEPISQSGLSSKHAGGVAGASASKAVSGFDKINSLIQVPKSFKGGAAHSEVDGLVQRIEKAPAGGHYVWIENQRHYVGKGYDLRVKRGDHVESGDVISDGLPNPSTIVAHKGVGEGRRYFVNAFRQALRDAGMSGHRRNIELLARGLINHVRLTEEMGDYAPDDIVPYSMLEHKYRPRPGFVQASPKAAVGKYLERPYLHYSVGTKVRKSMLPDFDEFGIDQVDVHDDEPPFQPEMVRGMANLQHDPDWMTRMFGSGLKSSFLKSVHHGSTSDATGTSFVPGLARGVDFGRIGKVQTPETVLHKVSAAGLTPAQQQYLAQLENTTYANLYRFRQAAQNPEPWKRRYTQLPQGSAARIATDTVNSAPWWLAFTPGGAGNWFGGIQAATTIPEMTKNWVLYRDYVNRGGTGVSPQLPMPAAPAGIQPLTVPQVQVPEAQIAEFRKQGLEHPNKIINEFNEFLAKGGTPTPEMASRVTWAVDTLQNLSGQPLMPELETDRLGYPTAPKHGHENFRGDILTLREQSFMRNKKQDEAFQKRNDALGILTGFSKSPQDRREMELYSQVPGGKEFIYQSAIMMSENLDGPGGIQRNWNINDPQFAEGLQQLSRWTGRPVAELQRDIGLAYSGKLKADFRGVDFDKLNKQKAVLQQQQQQLANKPAAPSQQQQPAAAQPPAAPPQQPVAQQPAPPQAPQPAARKGPAVAAIPAAAKGNPVAATKPPAAPKQQPVAEDWSPLPLPLATQAIMASTGGLIPKALQMAGPASIPLYTMLHSPRRMAGLMQKSPAPAAKAPAVIPPAIKPPAAAKPTALPVPVAPAPAAPKTPAAPPVKSPMTGGLAAKAPAKFTTAMPGMSQMNELQRSMGLNLNKPPATPATPATAPGFKQTIKNIGLTPGIAKKWSPW